MLSSGGERLHRPHRDGLLADVEVEEAADLAHGVELGRLLLEAPDEQHLAQQREGVRRDRARAAAQA